MDHRGLCFSFPHTLLFISISVVIDPWVTGEGLKRDRCGHTVQQCFCMIVRGRFRDGVDVDVNKTQSIGRKWMETDDARLVNACFE